MRGTRGQQVAAFQAMIAAGRIGLGMTREEVRAVLGEPDAMGCTSRRYRTPSCYRYGAVDVFFGPRARDGLDMVFSEEWDGSGAVVLLRSS
jgi:hypothetical protein